MPPEDAAPPSDTAPDTEPAQPSAEAPSLRDAFRADPDALKDRSPTYSAEDAAPKPAESEEPAPRDGASKPDPSEGPLSRRGAAAKITEQQSEIDRLVSEREAEKARNADAEARVKAHEDQRTRAQQAALARIGDDQEFARLSNARMRGSPMSYEDDEKLTSMLEAREWAADLWEMTDRAHKAQLSKRLGALADKHGLDKSVAYEGDLVELVEHACSVTEARVRKESADELAELKAQNRGLRTKTAHAAAPTVGGASGPGGAGMPGDGASPIEFFRTAVRAEASQSTNGRAATSARSSR